MTQRIVILPVQSDRDGTAYETAHEQTVATAESLDFSIVDPDDGDATAIVVVQMIDSAVIEETLAKNPSITWEQWPYAGVETFWPVARKYPDVTFTSAKGSYAPPVAEHALAWTLALLRHLPERIRATTWGASYGTTLNGANVVIVGGGGIGQELVRLFSTWNTTITVVRRSPSRCPAPTGLSPPNTLDASYPRLTWSYLLRRPPPKQITCSPRNNSSSMDARAVLVNIARGSLVDTDDLVAALADHKLRGVGLDVTDPEPLPDGHPLWAEPNCIITPHTADTPEMVIPLLDERIVRNLNSLAEGKSPDTLEGLVDVQAGY